jgi:hypothetical protein
MSRVELVVNGEIRESVAVGPREAAGGWSVKLDKSSWLALLVRGHYPTTRDRSSAFVAGHGGCRSSEFYAAADALTILEQIEGALAYLDTVGTRAHDANYKRMRLVLESAHRKIHNRMHPRGSFHEHTPAEDHAEHH